MLRTLDRRAREYRKFTDFVFRSTARSRIAYVSTVAVFLLLFGFVSLVCCVSALLILSPTEPFFEAGIEVFTPTDYVWPAFTAFVAFLIILHCMAFMLAPYGKTSLHAMEYTYLILGTFSLFGVSGIEIDYISNHRATIHGYMENERNAINYAIERAQKALFCSQPASKGPLKDQLCVWLERAKSAANRPLNEDSSDDKEAISALLNDGNELAKLNRSAGFAESPEFEIVQNTAGWAFEHLLKNGSKIAKFDEQMNDELQPKQRLMILFKLLGFYLLAFVIALRISKLTVETFDVVRKE